MDKLYGGVIWTNHALTRLRERGIKQGDAWATWKRPDSSEFNLGKGAWVYHRIISSKRIEVIAKKNEKGDWVILSVWSKAGREVKSRGKDTFWGRLKSKIFG